MLFQCWFIACNIDPTLSPALVKVLLFAGRRLATGDGILRLTTYNSQQLHWPDAGYMLGQCQKGWASIAPMLARDMVGVQSSSRQVLSRPPTISI